MRKLDIDISRHRFTVNCAEEDVSLMLAAAKRVEACLQEARDKHGVSDNERAALIAAMLVAFEAEKGDNTSAGTKQESLRRRQIGVRLDDVLSRTGSSAEAQHNNSNQ